MLLRTALFTICTIAALAIGTGSSTALFSVVHDVHEGDTPDKDPVAMIN